MGYCKGDDWDAQQAQKIQHECHTKETQIHMEDRVMIHMPSEVQGKETGTTILWALLGTEFDSKQSRGGFGGLADGQEQRESIIGRRIPKLSLNREVQTTLLLHPAPVTRSKARTEPSCV